MSAEIQYPITVYNIDVFNAQIIETLYTECPSQDVQWIEDGKLYTQTCDHSYFDYLNRKEALQNLHDSLLAQLETSQMSFNRLKNNFNRIRGELYLNNNNYEA